MGEGPRKKKNRSKNDYKSGQFGRHENSDGLKHTFHPRDFFFKSLFRVSLIKLVEINQSLHMSGFSRLLLHLLRFISILLLSCNIYLKIYTCRLSPILLV